jgi:hypothetical protein
METDPVSKMLYMSSMVYTVDSPKYIIITMNQNCTKPVESQLNFIYTVMGHLEMY